MLNFRALGLATLVISNFLAIQSKAGIEFESEIAVLKDKADKCDTELDTIKKPSNFCEEFSSFEEYLFKGSPTTYITYHMNNGDINQHNADDVMAILKKTIATLNRMSGG